MKILKTCGEAFVVDVSKDELLCISDMLKPTDILREYADSYILELSYSEIKHLVNFQSLDEFYISGPTSWNVM